MKGISLKEWRDSYFMIHSGYQDKYFVVDKMGETYPIYVQNIFSSRTAQLKGQLVVLLDIKKIQRLLPRLYLKKQK